MLSDRLSRWSLLFGAILLVAPSWSFGDETAGWKSLFNGKDLTGWKAIDGSEWAVENSVLSTKAGGKGWLATTDQHKNFELELEFRLPPGGNSGIFLRSPETASPTWDGMQIQVLDDDAPEHAKIEPWQHCGSLYGLAAAKPGAIKKAGEWQKYNILCDGQRVKVTLNGTVVVDANLADFQGGKAAGSLDGKPHPGIERTQGAIGLESHSTAADYRNLRVRTLP